VISIITPVYNAEAYIGQCLRSVLDQPFADWEWILVDDGSADRSLEILRGYAERDGRIHVFTQKNQGPAAARNLALDQAKGDYITFLDSDDWMEADALPRIGGAIAERHPDMVMWNFKRYTGNAFKAGGYPMPAPGYHDTDAVQEYAADFVFEYKRGKGQYFPSCWIRAFKKEIIQGGGLRFNPRLKRTEDYLFLAEAHARLQNMLVIDAPLTVYRANEGSITHNYTAGYMAMIDEIYDAVRKLPIGVSREELERRADLMYIYRAFVAIEQEIDRRAGNRFAEVKRIISLDRLGKCIESTSGIGRKVFGRKFTILQTRSAALMLAYYKIKR